MRLSVKILSFIALSLTLICTSLGVVLSAEPPTVAPGYDTDAIHLGGVRYRELATGADHEVYLGVPDLGNAARRTQTNLTWGTSNTFAFTYDSVLEAVKERIKEAIENLIIPETLYNLPNLDLRDTRGSEE